VCVCAMMVCFLEYMREIQCLRQKYLHDYASYTEMIYCWYLKQSLPSLNAET